MLHTPSKQPAIPRGAAAQRCIRFCLSLACPPRSKKCLSLSCFSFSLHRNILFCFSLALSCLSMFVCISLSISLLFLSLLGELLSVCLSPLLVPLARSMSLSHLSFLLHSCLTPLRLFLPPNFYFMNSNFPLPIFSACCFSS
jgi:hypothetical protein